MGFIYYVLKICVAGESWNWAGVYGHSGEIDQGALQKMYGAKIQGACCKQGTWRYPNRGQWHGLGKHFLCASPPSVDHQWSPRSWWGIQVTNEKTTLLFTTSKKHICHKRSYDLIYICIYDVQEGDEGICIEIGEISRGAIGLVMRESWNREGVLEKGLSWGKRTNLWYQS